jgi:aspartyl-tRNA(Asn)/glutamyl-tRNA(Gln) amidotransferase subunit A
MAAPPFENTFAFWRTLAAHDPARAARTVLTRIAALAPEHRRAIFAAVPDTETLTTEFSRGAATRGPLAGVPFVVKDLFAVAGYATGAGSTFLAQLRGIEREDAPLVAHLRQAGAVFAGKTHLHEFAFGLTGENPHFGDGPNLRFPGRLSGGSSSGSAAAVAGGIVPFALGTDTGGSVRVPSAFNGLWGFRARPHDGWVEKCFPLSETFDTAGWFTDSAGEMLELMRVMFGAPQTTGRREGFIRLAARELAPEIDDGIATVLDRAAASFAELLPGDELRMLRAALTDALPAYVVIQNTDAAKIHAAWMDAHRADYDPVVWDRIDRGRRWNGDDIARARARQAEVKTAITTLLSRYGGLVLPATPRGAFFKHECTEENRARLLQLTHAASLAGTPVATLPVRLADGTTSGLQVILPAYYTEALVGLLTRFDQRPR